MAKDIKIRFRDKELKDKWAGVNDKVPVNPQYVFEDYLFECKLYHIFHTQTRFQDASFCVLKAHPLPFPSHFLVSWTFITCCLKMIPLLKVFSQVVH